MATKAKRNTKITAAKSSTKGAGKSGFKPTITGGIPEGFTMPASANTPFHDFTINPVLQGSRIAVREVARKKVKEGEKKTMQIMTVRNTKGELVAVSDSYALLGIFAESKNGAEIYIRHDGQKKIAGGHKVNLFTTAYKNPAAGKK
jgi:hypothetical protein